MFISIILRLGNQKQRSKSLHFWISASFTSGKQYIISQLRLSSIFLKLPNHHFTHVIITKLSVQVGLAKVLPSSRSEKTLLASLKGIRSFEGLLWTSSYLGLIFTDTEVLASLQFIFPKVFLDHSLYFQIYLVFSISSWVTNFWFYRLNLVFWLYTYLLLFTYISIYIWAPTWVEQQTYLS